jgi:hypothetical protein
LKRSPEQLDQTRRAWLADLVRQHTAEPSAANALALARGEWMCGEYDDALGHFIEARDRAPDLPETHLSLVRSASMLGLQALEASALEHALQHHPGHPELDLHAALARIPGDLAAARALFQQHRANPLCAQYDQALALIERGETPQPDRAGDPRQVARWDSLRWTQLHSTSREVHTGLPTNVLLRAIAAAPDHGLTLECGVYFGRSLQLIAERTHGPVHGFDSFQGLPEAWNANEGPGSYSTAGRLPQVADNVTLHAGWFEDTLPSFFATHAGPIRLLHVDCDLYSSTRTVLATADERLVPGSIVVFDDMLGYAGYEQHELRAFEEFVDARKVGWKPIATCLLGREVAIQITRR